MRTAAPLLLSPEARSALTTWAHGRSFPVRRVPRANIVQMAADGPLSQDIARALNLSRPTVQRWRERFLALRFAGLEQAAPRPGRIPRIPEKNVRARVEATLQGKPPQATPWRTRRRAQAQGLSQAPIRRIWKHHHRNPHRLTTFTLSRDNRFVEKRDEVVGLSLKPPDQSLVRCVDENRHRQALDRTQPGLPLKKGRCGTRPPDYTRHGTTPLGAALRLREGPVLGACLPRHRQQAFMRVRNTIDTEPAAALERHIIVDNYATHTHPRVQSWLRRPPRFPLPCIPTSSSWVNRGARWFREITDTRIRRGIFRNVPELIAAIQEFLENHHQNPRIVTWTASVESILTNVSKCTEALDSLH